MTNDFGLIYQLTKRDVAARYKGSILGILWSLLNPLLMLVIYTIFFSVILNMRWGLHNESKSDYAVLLFTGLILYNFIAECINRAPGLITGNANYVKKVVFPLHILPIVSSGSALFHWLISLVVLLLALVFVGTGIPATAPLIVVVMIPLVLYSIGIGWILAAIGVFVRDINQIVGVFTQMLMFMSPVFFPASKIPEPIRWVFFINPLTDIIQQARIVVVYGAFPDWTKLAMQTAIALVVCVVGYTWFKTTKRGFADVL